MIVKMRHQISGTRNGEDWPAPGGLIDVGEDEARVLFANGHAVHEDDELPEGDHFLGTKALAPTPFEKPEAAAESEPESVDEPDAEPESVDEPDGEPEPKAKGRRAQA